MVIGFKHCFFFFFLHSVCLEIWLNPQFHLSLFHLLSIYQNMHWNIHSTSSQRHLHSKKIKKRAKERILKTIHSKQKQPHPSLSFLTPLASLSLFSVNWVFLSFFSKSLPFGIIFYLLWIPPNMIYTCAYFKLSIFSLNCTS